MTQFGTEFAETKKSQTKAGSRNAIQRVIDNYRSWGAPDDAERTDFLGTFADWVDDEDEFLPRYNGYLAARL